MTQSAVSQAITAIEVGLGAQLIDRSVRPMKLTLFGTAFFERATELCGVHVTSSGWSRCRITRGCRCCALAWLIRSRAPPVRTCCARSRRLPSRWSVGSGVQETGLKALDRAARRSDHHVRRCRRATLIYISLPILREPLFIVAPKGNADGQGEHCGTGSIDCHSCATAPRLLSAARLRTILRQRDVP